MRPVATLLISLAMALGAIGLAVAAPGGLGGEQELAQARLQAASGAIGISNSRDGEVIFDVSAIRPGWSDSGEVTIGNDGDVPGRFAVRTTEVVDGPAGGKLSEALELVLVDVTDPQNPVPVHHDQAAQFGQVDLGELAAGEQRDYRIVATLPAAAGNGFQGSVLSLRFEWRAGPVTTTIAPAPTPTPPPTAAPPTPTTPATPPQTPATPPSTPSTPPSTPTTPSTPSAPPVALADALGLPTATSCVKSGRLTLRVKAPGGAKVLAAVVKVNGRVKARLKGSKAAKPVTLRGLKKKTKLSISVKASDRRTYSAARTFKPCKR